MDLLNSALGEWNDYPRGACRVITQTCKLGSYVQGSVFPSAILRDCLCLCTFTKGCDVWHTAKVGTVCQLALAWAALWTQLDSRSQREVNNYRLRAIMTPCLKMQRQLVELRIIIYALPDTVWSHFSLKTPIKPIFFLLFWHIFVFGTYLI